MEKVVIMSSPAVVMCELKHFISVMVCFLVDCVHSRPADEIVGGSFVESGCLTAFNNLLICDS